MLNAYFMTFHLIKYIDKYVLTFTVLRNYRIKFSCLFRAVGFISANWGSSVGIVSDYRLDDRFDLRQGQRNFPLASVSRPALGPTQPPVQCILGVLPPGVKSDQGVTLTTTGI
jgi:hypothetical protein